MIEDITRVSGQSMDIEGMNKEKLMTIFPECFSEGKLDIDKLLNLCGEYIDNDFEKYKFEWKGKSECYRIAGKRSTGTLRPCKEESVNFDTTKNMYIEGDNLEVLKLLQASYYRKVKMIYIDPPYNTGNDFVYEDDFADPMAKYKEVTGQTTKSNPETMGRYHTNWLNMMYPRLRLASNLLRDDGVIFISIDDNEVTNLRKLCDEVFGEESFIAQICHKARASISNDKIISSNHNHILLYAKNYDEIFKQRKNIGLDPDLEGFTLQDENGYYKLIPVDGPGGAKKGNPYYEFMGVSGYWRYSQETMQEKYNAGLIVKSENSLQQKYYLAQAENSRKTDTTWWDTDVLTSNATKDYIKLMGGKYFDNPKNVNLLIRMLKEYTHYDKNAIILDFFSGSGTTAHAVMQLNSEDNGNRQFIMVQLPELCDEKSEAYKAGYKNICEIGKERIRRAGAKIKSEFDKRVKSEELRVELNNNSLNSQNSTLKTQESSPLSKLQTLDIGFKVFKLDTSNLVKWDSTPTEDTQELTSRMALLKNTIKPDRNDLDMVYETMLKLGIPLDYKIEEVKVNDKKAYSIGEDCLVLICLDYGQEGITADDIKTMCEEYVPAKIVASEQAFKDDVALSNAHYILKDHNIEMKLL